MAVTKKAGQTPAKKASKPSSANAEPANTQPEIKLEVQIQDSKSLPAANSDAVSAAAKSLKEHEEEVKNAAESEAVEEESEEEDEGDEEEDGDEEEGKSIAEADGVQNEEEEGSEEEETREEQQEGDEGKKSRSNKVEGSSREFEVFIGDLPVDAVEEDVKKALEQAGEVVHVRVIRKYGFARFTTKAAAQRACTEFKTVEVKGKPCNIVPCVDDTILFVGNIATSWTKSRVAKTVKKYGIKGIRKLTLKENEAKKGANRGFAIIEFHSHEDARNALKRLSKKDAAFGKNKSAKLRWLDANELDEAALSQAKAVVTNEIPASWTEDKVTVHFSKFGEIEHVTLNQKKKKSKQVDYAMIEYTTHEAAASCVDALNDTELVEGDEKIKLKVKLFKPYAKPRRKVVVYGGLPVPKAVQLAQSNAQQQSKKSPIVREVHPSEPLSARKRAPRKREPVKVPLSRSGRYSRPEKTRLQWMQNPEFRRGHDVTQTEYSRLPPRRILDNVQVPRHGDSYSLRAGRDIDYGHDGSAELRRVRDYIDPVHSLKRPFSSLDADPGYYTSIARGLPRARVDPLTVPPLDSSRVLGDPYSIAVEGRGLVSPSSVGPYSKYGALSGSSLVGGGGRGSLYPASDYISSDAELRASTLLGGWPASSRYSYLGSGAGPYY